MNRTWVVRAIAMTLAAAFAIAGIAVISGQRERHNQKQTNAVPVVMVESSGAPLKNLFAGITPTPRYFQLAKNNEPILARNNQVSCGAFGRPSWIDTTLLSLKQFLGLSSTVHAQSSCGGCHIQLEYRDCNGNGYECGYYTIAYNDPGARALNGADWNTHGCESQSYCGGGVSQQFICESEWNCV